MNLYDILEISENASEKEIKKAYKRLALLYHPDKNSEPNATEKFQTIQTAYNILIDHNTRIDYCKMNRVKQNNFVNLLQKIFEDKIILDEIKNIGIFFEKKDWTYLENNFKELFNALNLKEFLKFFKEGKFPKKKIDTTLILTDSENSICSNNDIYTDNYETYSFLPIYYQKNSNLDIQIKSDICLNDIIENNIKKIKLKRSVNGKLVENTFIFNISKNYVVFPNCGDICNEIFGNLIIQLNLPKFFYWSDNLIVFEQTISLYEMIYGLDINLQISDTNMKFPNWVPSRDGFYIEINNFKIKNYNLAIKLILNYEHTEEKKDILLNYFS